MTNTDKAKTAGLWALKGLAAFAFGAAAAFKLSGAPMMVHEFDLVGLGQGFRLLTGLVEAVGVILLLVPKTSRWGGLVLLTVCVGALVAQITRIHQDVVHVFVLMALTGFLAWSGWRSQSRPAVALA